MDPVSGPGPCCPAGLHPPPAAPPSKLTFRSEYSRHHLSCFYRHGSEIAATARGPQAFALWQKPASHLGFVLAGLGMFGQQPAPEIAARRRSLLADDLYVKPAIAQRLSLVAVEIEGAADRAVHAGAGREVQDRGAGNADAFAYHDMRVGGRPGKARERAGDLQAVARQGRDHGALPRQRGAG